VVYLGILALQGQRGGAFKHEFKLKSNLLSLQDIITPFIGAIFQGSHFNQLSFTINYSVFKYGDFINALIVFMIIVAFLYFAVVRPLEHLMYSVYKNKALTKECPYCLEEICLVATRCKFCSGEIVVPKEELDEMKALVDATAASRSRGCSRWLPCLKRKTQEDQQLEQQQQALRSRVASRIAGSGLRTGSIKSRAELEKPSPLGGTIRAYSSQAEVDAPTADSLSPAASFESTRGDFTGDVEAPYPCR
jgi:large conductance mechanosensitive channel